MRGRLHPWESMSISGRRGLRAGERTVAGREERWPLLMQWRIPAITKLKQAWDNYSRQHGRDWGHGSVESRGDCARPSETFMNKPAKLTENAISTRGFTSQPDIISLHDLRSACSRWDGNGKEMMSPCRETKGRIIYLLKATALDEEVRPIHQCYFYFYLSNIQLSCY